MKDSTVSKVMALVDEYADALHSALREDGGIQFADGIVAKAKKDAIRARLREADAEPLKALEAALPYVMHCGANAMMQGGPHPQAWLVAQMMEALGAAPELIQTNAGSGPTELERKLCRALALIANAAMHRATSVQREIHTLALDALAQAMGYPTNSEMARAAMRR